MLYLRCEEGRCPDISQYRDMRGVLVLLPGRRERVPAENPAGATQRRQAGIMPA